MATRCSKRKTEKVLEMEETTNDHEVRLSVRFTLCSFITLMAIGFASGRSYSSVFWNKPTVDHAYSAKSNNYELPLPTFPQHKSVPRVFYTEGHYVSSYGEEVTKSAILELQKLDEWTDVEHVSSDDDEHEDDGEIHEPAGQHLLIDIENVDSKFLDSEERLAEAMLKIVEVSGLTLLSYHCHSILKGVNCIGVLLESHVAFHTWPSLGVIALDLFTCGPQSLLPVVPILEDLFGVHPEDFSAGDEAPHMIWSHKKRGFKEQISNPEQVDIDQFLLGWADLEMKSPVVNVKTKFQEIQAYDVIDPTKKTLKEYHKSLSNDGSYESQHKELFKPDRILYLDGVLQSRILGESSYHEALVHPAMVAQGNPKRVAIIGGGEGATLREVLKHKTVEKATMIEIDEEMVDVAKEHLPHWSDCSDLLGSADSCFDDPRADVHYADAVAWFIDAYSDVSQLDSSEKYDVIIMDALDPSSEVPYSDVLYDSMSLTQAMYNALSDNGVLIAQVGAHDFLDDPPKAFSKNHVLDGFIEKMKKIGFKSIMEYAESHGGFQIPWSFLVAVKDLRTKTNWYASEAQIDLQLQSRLMPTASGENPLRHFDGSTMKEYQYPSRIDEEVYCQVISSSPLCEHGNGFDPERPNAPITAFKITQNGVFAKEDLSRGTYIAIDASVHDLEVPPSTQELIRRWVESNTTRQWDSFKPYTHGNGFSSTSNSIGPGLSTFTNHGCNGAFNVGTPLQLTHPTNTRNPVDLSVHDPVAARNHRIHQHPIECAVADIKAGAELLDNYMCSSHANLENQCLSRSTESGENCEAATQ